MKPRYRIRHGYNTTRIWQYGKFFKIKDTIRLPYVNKKLLEKLYMYANLQISEGSSVFPYSLPSF